MDSAVLVIAIVFGVIGGVAFIGCWGYGTIKMRQGIRRELERHGAMRREGDGSPHR